jgi:hypothetical protein
MKLRLIIPALLAAALPLGAQGLRKDAGQTFLEPLQKRDSVLIADQFRYGVTLENITDGTPLAFPELKPEKDSPLEILGDWQLDSTRISKKKEQPARYDIRASIVLTAFDGGNYLLPDIPVLVNGDTLVFKAPEEPLEVKELPIDMESFQAHDIKPQVRFPYTFNEILPWLLGFLGLIGLIVFLYILIQTRRKAARDKEMAEPAHIRALRKLDKYRGDKFWKPENQKVFYSGVTDALREYIVSRYGVGAMEMTTAEIFEGLRGSDIPKDLYEEMKALFERADFVKFAKFTATDEENATVLPQAVHFVTATYQAQLEEEIPGQAGNEEKKEEA